jgi:hypothetical protein
MSRILAAVAGLNPEAEPAAIDQLFDVAKKFKPLPVPDTMEPPTEYHMDAEGSYPIPLDQCDTDPSYQRPLDREKVAAMKLDKAWEKQPIHVNMDGGTYWIIDGQHRAEAARQSGVKEVHAFVDFMPSQSEAKHETGVMAKTAFTPHPDHGKSVPAHIKSYPALKDHLVSQSAKHGGAWVAENTFGEATQYHYKNRSSVPAHFRGESHHHDGLAVNGKWQGWTHSQIVRDQNSWGKTASDLLVGDAYEGHVLPSMEPDLIFTLEGLGAYHEVAKVAPYGWHGKCYVVRCSTGTITYVPHSAVEKDAGAILTLPERGLLRFEGMAEDEVQYVLKTIDLDVAPIHLPSPAPHAGARPLAEVLGIEGDVEILAEGIGGRTWPAEWLWMDDGGVAVFNERTTLAYYPVISRHPTGEGDWRLVGPKHDLTVRPA